MPRTRDTTEWMESDSATNGVATATHAAEPGNVHFVTLIAASFTGAGNTADLTIKDGATTLATVSVHDDLELALEHPIKMSTGNKAEISLAAGGTSVDGNVALGGFTRSK